MHGDIKVSNIRIRVIDWTCLSYFHAV